MATEGCPFAYRKGTDKNVHCTLIARMPRATFDFCAKQYRCGQTGRWEAKKTGCEIRQKEERGEAKRKE